MYVFLYLRDAANSGCQKVFAAGFGQLFRFVPEFMPESATKSARPSFHPRRSARTFFTVSTSEVLPGKNPASHGQALTRYGQSDNNLRTPGSIF